MESLYAHSYLSMWSGDHAMLKQGVTVGSRGGTHVLCTRLYKKVVDQEQLTRLALSSAVFFCHLLFARSISKDRSKVIRPGGQRL